MRDLLEVIGIISLNLAFICPLGEKMDFISQSCAGDDGGADLTRKG